MTECLSFEAGGESVTHCPAVITANIPSLFFLSIAETTRIGPSAEACLVSEGENERDEERKRSAKQLSLAIY